MTPLQLVRQEGASGKFIQTIPNPLSREGRVMITPLLLPFPSPPTLCCREGPTLDSARLPLDMLLVIVLWPQGGLT